MEPRTYSINPSAAIKVDQLWAIAKPSGLASHPAANLDDDLLSWCRREHGGTRSLAPINRLDRATSGVVLASECPKTRASIGEAFAQHKVTKEYLALVHGRLGKDVIIDRPLLDRRRGKKLEATTRIDPLEFFPKFTYLKSMPVTGRKHQIRRHLRGAGHAILGDSRYGNQAIPQGAPERLWLHCVSVILPDGTCFTTPLPPELQEHLHALRAVSVPMT